MILLELMADRAGIILLCLVLVLIETEGSEDIVATMSNKTASIVVLHQTSLQVLEWLIKGSLSNLRRFKGTSKSHKGLKINPVARTMNHPSTSTIWDSHSR